MKASTNAILLLCFALSACADKASKEPTRGTATHAAPSMRTSVGALPSAGSAAQPDLLVAPDGDLLLSWIESDADTHTLKVARSNAGHWSTPQAIASGNDWFVNWADTPHLAATPDGALWAHWLQKSATAGYAYDVMLVRSSDGGRTWSKPFRVNDDGKDAEHGFVSLWPASRDTLGIAWLDGRESAGDDEHAGHHGHDVHGEGAGAMTLRAAMFDPQLQRHGETRLDAMTCDCCQTDVAMTARGPLLVYRDRTPEEIRDIAVSRLEQGTWTASHVVHADHWKMPACPVNGPAVSATGNDVLVGWYTAAGDLPTLKLARSRDAGDSFGTAVVVDQGEAVQGRVDVAFDPDAAWILWLREDATGQSLHLARYAPDLSRELQRIEVARLQGRGRGTGFPQLALREGTAHVVWTDIIAGKPGLHAAIVTR
jgi:hypothetical protein